MWDYYRVIKGDTRSLEYGLYNLVSGTKRNSDSVRGADALIIFTLPQVP